MQQSNRRGERKQEQPTTGQERTQGAKPLRPFFLRIVRKGKRRPNNTPKEKTRTKQEKGKARTTKAKPQKIGRKRKAQAKKKGNSCKTIKTGANTQKVFYPPNLSRTQKPHKPRKARKQYKPTQTP